MAASLTITDAANGETPPKRKAPDGDGDADVDMAAEPATDVSKRPKTDGANGQANGQEASPEEVVLAHARATAAYIPFLSPDHLIPPKMPTREEMEHFLLDLRKKALVEEYFGDQQA